MFSRLAVVKSASLFAVLVTLCAAAPGDEPGKKLIDSRWNQVKAAGLTPVPVYSKDARSPSVIKANGGNAIGSSGAVAWTPIGWCENCSWPLNEGDVFFNVSDAGATVKVGGFELKPGESAVFEKGRFRRDGATAAKPNGQIAASAVPAVRGWSLDDGQSWLAVTIPLTALPKSFRLEQCELLEDGKARASAVAVVPPADATGFIRGALEVSRDNSDLAIGSYRVRPAKKIEDPSTGTMRMSFPRDVSFQDVSLYQFRVDTTLVVGADATLRISPSSLQIPATSDVTIVSEYGWKARLASSNLSGLRFKVDRGAAIDILFPVDAADVSSLVFTVDEKSVGTVAVAEAPQ